MKPMLAKSYDPKKVVFPALISPKLDGVRCLAFFKPTGVELWSRDQKPITMPHIAAQLEELRLPPGTILDGELYTHGLPFQELSGHVRRSLDDHRKRMIDYHVYDVAGHPDGIERQAYAARHAWLSEALPESSIVRLVPAEPVRDHDHVQQLERAFVEAGFEGAMVRTRGMTRATKKAEGTTFDDYYHCETYGHSRRSDFLVKVKSFDDDEAVIVGIEEEVDLSGVPKGRTGKFVMRLKDGTEFRASGLTDSLKAETWANPERFIGQTATFKYFGKSTEGVPRHPNFKALRPEGELDAAV